MELGTEDLFTDSLAAEDKARGLIEDVAAALKEGEGYLFARAVTYGEEHFIGGGDAAGLTRALSQLGRQVEEKLDGRGLSAADRRQVREVWDEASARSLEGFVQASKARRDKWLSYHAHEMRNALNTLVNAQWILKNSEGKNTTKVFDMAERAVRRLEASVKEMRELEVQSEKPAPGRPDKT